ncbi:transmembrane protein 51-like [Polymixia lowei]
MRSTDDAPRSPPRNEGTDNNHNNNNTNNNININNNDNVNYGSQYALCALGVGLVALGSVMIMWSTSAETGGGGRPDNRSIVSSIAFAMVGSGMVMLLLSRCLGKRNKRREQQRLLAIRRSRGAASGEQEGGETIYSAEERAQPYAVPSYEEVVASGQYPVCQSNLHHSPSQLPSYDDLVQVDRVQYEFEPAAGISIEPLTPPPQYDNKVPPL